MKLIFVLALSFGIYAAAQSNGDSADEISMQNIINAIETLFKAAKRPEEKFVLNVFSTSIDKNCMLQKYKTKNLVSKIPTKETIGTGQNVSLEVLLTDIAVICSTKTDAFLESTFNVLMSFQVLLKSFIEDSEYREYTNILTCANSYAVENNILDPSVYDFNESVLEVYQETCDDFIEEKNRFVAEA